MSDKRAIEGRVSAVNRSTMAKFRKRTGRRSLGWRALRPPGSCWLVSRDRIRDRPQILLPGPGEVFATFIDIVRNGYRETTLWQNGGVTLWRCGAGFVLACLTGVPLGLAMGHNRKIRAACNYIVQFMRPLPPLSYMILLILWFGTGDLSKGHVAVSYRLSDHRFSFGGRRARGQAAAHPGGAGARRSRRAGVPLCHLPSAAPMIFTGLRIALAAAFSTVVAAELLAATDGLGWMVISASTFLRNDIIILGIIILGLLGRRPGRAAARSGSPGDPLARARTDARAAELGRRITLLSMLLVTAAWIAVTASGWCAISSCLARRMSGPASWN